MILEFELWKKEDALMKKSDEKIMEKYGRAREKREQIKMVSDELREITSDERTRKPFFVSAKTPGGFDRFDPEVCSE